MRGAMRNSRPRSRRARRDPAGRGRIPLDARGISRVAVRAAAGHALADLGAASAGRVGGEGTCLLTYGDIDLLLSYSPASAWQVVTHEFSEPQSDRSLSRPRLLR